MLEIKNRMKGLIVTLNKTKDFIQLSIELVE